MSQKRRGELAEKKKIQTERESRDEWRIQGGSAVGVRGEQERSAEVTFELFVHICSGTYRSRPLGAGSGLAVILDV